MKNKIMDLTTYLLADEDINISINTNDSNINTNNNILSNHQIVV